MRLFRAIPILMTALASGACSAAAGAGSAEADAGAAVDSIVHGHADLGDPAVVAIDIDGAALCTGSLIAPNWVLTARHCVSDTSESVACPSSVAQIYGDRDPTTLLILVGSDVATATPVAYGKRLLLPGSDVLCGEDIALVELDRAVNAIAPLPVALGDEPGVGSKLRAVGFGKRGDAKGAGKKYARDAVSVLSATASEFVVGEVSCNGDSGGPALDASGAVVGVVSRGGPGCEGPAARNVYTRTGHFAALLKQALGASPEPACGSAHHCPKGFHCDAHHECRPTG